MQLAYGDSKSEGKCYAIKLRMHVDPVLDELYESYQNEERIEFVEPTVREEVDGIRDHGGDMTHEAIMGNDGNGDEIDTVDGRR